ncbi:hypothetical protein TWF730_003845 [Orbilia blumenaviensis]|uniref:UBC core domain-containing protein n=1 Tax=Orbilia blumenaviensis TaxID=1796055 RepID=A0AAV9U1E5_9PEZI
MSSSLAAGTCQDELHLNQPSNYWLQPRQQHWTPRPLIFSPSNNDLNLGEKIPACAYPSYQSRNSYVIPQEIGSGIMLSNSGLGSQLNPILLSSDEEEEQAIYQGEAPPTAHSYLWASHDTLYAHSEPEKQYMRKGMRGNVEEANSSFFAATASGSSVPATQYYHEYEGTHTGTFNTILPSASQKVALIPYQTSSLFFSNTTGQQTPHHWNKTSPNPSPFQSPIHFPDPVPTHISKDLIDSNQSSRYASTVPKMPPNMTTSFLDKSGLDDDKSVSRATNSSLRGQKRKVASLQSSAIPEDLEKVQTFFTGFLHEERMASLPCRHGTAALSSIFLVIRSDDRKKEGSLPYSYDGKTCLFRCSDCKVTVCAGCGADVGKLKAPFSGLSHYCIDSHLLSIVIVLAKIDARWQLREFGSPSQRKTDSSPTPPTPSPTQSMTPAPLGSANSVPTKKAAISGAGAGTGTGYGTGHVGGGRKSGPSGKKPAKSARRLKQESGDNKYLTDLLSQLTALLTDKEGEASVVSLLTERRDVLIPAIKISYLPELLGSLVRNDSIMDIDACDTWEMYASCLEILRLLSSHDALLEVLITAPQEKKSSPGIAHLVRFPNLDPLKGFIPSKRRAFLLTAPEPVEFILVDGFDGIGQPVIYAFQRLVRQCQAFMSNASRVVTDDVDEETTKLLSFCVDVGTTAIELDRRAEELREKKDRARPLRASKNSHLQSLSPEILSHPMFTSSRGSSSSSRPRGPLDIPTDVMRECRSALSGHLQFSYSPAVAATHSGVNPYGGPNADNHGSSSSAPGRMKRLIKELTVLSTTLPPGIFVRVQEDRPELFKAIIVGPESSPYHMGLYEFDFTIPNNYPLSPPLVLFKTTGGGRVRFNPNLYEAGKVCLSILGTWSGAASEQWQPKTSTLLQVLVSIQSMILCAEPYYNEPGYERQPNSPASRAYNENVQLNSIRLAMNDWLSYDGLWNDVIQAHFLARTAEILSATHEFVANCNVDAPAPLSIGNHISPPFPQAFHTPAAMSMHGLPNLKGAMQEARQDLENTMKSRLSSFLKAGMWKESTG